MLTHFLAKWPGDRLSVGSDARYRLTPTSLRSSPLFACGGKRGFLIFYPLCGEAGERVVQQSVGRVSRLCFMQVRVNTSKETHPNRPANPTGPAVAVVDKAVMQVLDVSISINCVALVGIKKIE